MPLLKLRPAGRAFQRRRADGDNFDPLLAAALANAGLTAPILFTQTATIDTPTTTSLASPSTTTVTVLPSIVSSPTPSPAFTPPPPAPVPPSSTTPTPMPPSYASAWASQSSGIPDKSTATPSPSSNSKSVPVAAVVIPVLIAVLIIIAFIVLLVRKRLIGKRVKRRSKWAQNLFPEPFPRRGEPGGDPERGMDEVPAANPMSFGGASLPAFERPPPPPPVALPSPPPMSYITSGGPISMPVPEPAGAPTASTSSFGAVSTHRPQSMPVAVVRSTFLPSLPDELSISAGELVRVVTEFDDGWALCETAAGEQGVVPLECLDTGDMPAPLRPVSTMSIGDWRNSKRASSLRGTSGVAFQPYGRF